MKTHKWKVHGVASDRAMDSVKEEVDDEKVNGSSDEKTIELKEEEVHVRDLPSAEHLTASVKTCLVNADEESHEDILCELCSKTFPSTFLLHIHLSNVHGIQPSNNSIPLSNSSPATKKSPPFTHQQTPRLKQTPQVQLRVTCQVCKKVSPALSFLSLPHLFFFSSKELCNKYFLRAHMRNVHNITVDELRLNPRRGSIDDFNPTENSCSRRKSSLSNDIENDPLLDGRKESESSTKSPLLSMQAFLVESDDDLYKDLFVPCMVYLPCRHRVTKPLQIAFKLKPVENPSETTRD